MQLQFVVFVAFDRHNGVIGTDHATHGASDAAVGRVCFLSYTVIDFIFIPGLFRNIQHRFKYSFSKHPQFNGIDRANRRAFAAKGAFALTPRKLPRQIFDT
jgi:hypothetical protein